MGNDSLRLVSRDRRHVIRNLETTCCWRAEARVCASHHVVSGDEGWWPGPETVGRILRSFEPPRSCPAIRSPAIRIEPEFHDSISFVGAPGPLQQACQLGH